MQFAQIKAISAMHDLSQLAKLEIVLNWAQTGIGVVRRFADVTETLYRIHTKS